MPTMRAVLVKDGKGPVENLYIGEIERPVATEGRVLVKVAAFGVSRYDLAQREGASPPPPGASVVLGMELSGTVHELGPGATKWSVGDQVCGIVKGGAYAEYAVCHQDLLIKKPAYVTLTEAASVPASFIVAYEGLVKHGEIKKGDHVLIHAGASGVAFAAAQMARFFGADTVTATAPTTEKVEWLRSIPDGPTHAIDYTSDDAEFAAHVKKTTGGKGVDIVLDCVGRNTWKKSIDALAVDGRLVLLALFSGSTVPLVDLSRILYKRLRIQGCAPRTRGPEYLRELIDSADFGAIVERITGPTGNGPIRTYVHRAYAWEEIQQAHRELAEEKNTSGKIVVTIP